MDKLGLAIHNGFMYSWNTHDQFSNTNPFKCIKQVDQTLKHYTQPKTVPIILNSEKIRLSKIDGMRNDTTEGRFVWDFFWITCRDLLDEDEIPYEFYDGLKKNLNREYLHHFPSLGKTMDCDMYVACFTSKNDEEVIFDRYGPCAIEFGSMLDYLTDLLKPPMSECIELCRVLYSPSIFRDYLRKAIVDPYKVANVDEWPRLYPYFNNLISYWSCLVKSPYWDNERECRILFYLPKDDDYRSKLINEYPWITEDSWDHVLIPLKPILKTTFIRSRNESEILQIIDNLNDHWECIQRGPTSQSSFLQYDAVLEYKG